MSAKYIIIQTTTNSQELTNKISSQLLENKLAACIQVSKITSKYLWKDKVQAEQEYLLSIKTKTDLYKDIEQEILKHHNYETPEIISIPINEINEKYQKWIDDCLI